MLLSGFCWAIICTAQTTIQPSANLYANAASITIQGNLNNNGSINANAATQWLFNGTAEQTIGGSNSIQFGSLTLNNSNGLTLGNNINILSIANFQSGKISLGNYNCTMAQTASLTGYNSINYFVTNGSGQLKQTIGNAQTVFYPVGTSTSYLPYSFTNNGTADVYSIRVDNGSYLNYNSSSGVGMGTAISNLAVNKTWVINEATPGGSNFNLTLQWNAANELSGFNRNQAEIRYFDYNTASWKTASAYLSANGTDPYSLTKTISGISNLNNFPIGIFSVGAALPLQWLSFNAVQNGNDVKLDWTINQQIGNKYFNIQRSDDGNQFSTIGKINSTLLSDYSYTDSGVIALFKTALKPLIFYRLQQVDIDGKNSYSKTVPVNLAFAGNNVFVKIYPNPVHSILNIQWYSNNNESCNIRMIDARGVLIKQAIFAAEKGINNTSFAVQSLSAGYYTVQLITKNGTKEIMVLKN